MATLCTELMTLLTYWRAMVATLSAKLFSKGNWNAMVNTDLVVNVSAGPWFVDGPTSRLEVKSRVVRCVVANASFKSPWSKLIGSVNKSQN